MRKGRGKIGTTRSPATLLASLLLIPFLALSLIAPGTMLTGNATDGIRIVICTGSGPMEMVQAEDGSLNPVDDDGDHDAAATCDWFLHAQAALTPQTLASQLIAAVESDADPAVRRSDAHRPGLLTEPLPRGPPRAA